MASAIQLKPGPLVPIGPAARGKSSLAARLIIGGLNPQTIVSWDETRAEVCPSQPCACADARSGCPGKESCFCQNAKCLSIVTHKLMTHAKNKSYFYVDATNLKTRDWALTLQLAKENSLEATALLFDEIPLEELFRRNDARDRQVPREAIEKHVALHRGITVGRLKAAGFTAVHLIDDQTEFIL